MLTILYSYYKKKGKNEGHEGPTWPFSLFIQVDAGYFVPFIRIRVRGDENHFVQKDVVITPMEWTTPLQATGYQSKIIITPQGARN